jgi:sigma-B regulation protein RsbU (phosphoserine phosphatase)
MPMRNKDGAIIGVFQLLNKRSGMFGDDDMTFLEALSVHAALAIENARLHEQERQKVRIERDLKAAREVQMSLLPRALPQVPGYEFAASTTPALEVAGDLYDFIPLEAGKLAFCLGDVSGKGLAASLLMANMQATMRDQAHIAASAAECVGRTNLLLWRSTAPEKFVTLFYGILDPVSHTLSYCNAGHEPGLLLSSAPDARRLSAGGVILGIMEDFPFEVETVSLEPGAVVVVYSDGISEATDPAGVQFGAGRIEAIVRDYRQAPAEEVRSAILAAVRSHSAGVPPADDITLLVCRRRA